LALPHVDGALAELSESDRDAVILRFFQQRSFRDVAQTLGTSEEAAKKRVSRALERLRGLLSRRGIAISAAALTAGLSQMPVLAAPAAWPSTLAALAVSGTVPTLSTSATLLDLVATTRAKLVVISLVILGGFAALMLRYRSGSSVETAPNPIRSSMPMVKLVSVMVDDQDKALKFYTEVLGFVKKRDMPAGASRWLTVVSAEELDGTELLLEPTGFSPARTFQEFLRKAGIPLTQFAVADVQNSYERLTRLGVVFLGKPTKTGPITLAVLDDTCGNLIQLIQK
jgi:predicted enzyme related to lactoylglutathione lyase